MEKGEKEEKEEKGGKEEKEEKEGMAWEDDDLHPSANDGRDRDDDSFHPIHRTNNTGGNTMVNRSSNRHSSNLGLDNSNTGGYIGRFHHHSSLHDASEGRRREEGRAQ